MTIPAERVRSMKAMREFCVQLIRPDARNDLDIEANEELRKRLRHYPTNAEIDALARADTTGLLKQKED